MGRILPLLKRFLCVQRSLNVGCVSLFLWSPLQNLRMEPKPSDEKIEKLRMQLAEKALADLITVWRIPATLMIITFCPARCFWPRK